MDEYLFFQQHKRYLKDNNSILSPRIFSGKQYEFNAPAPKESTANLRASYPKATFLTHQTSQSNFNFMPSPKIQPSPKVNDKGLMIFPPEVELNSETMEDCLKDLSSKYTDQYVSSGFPPKVCTLILKELIKENKLRTRILDLGCGKGHVGEYLREDGFLHITGMDCSKNLLAIAQEKRAYERLEKVVFGKDEVHPDHMGKYDVVISASMINNDGWDDQTFHQMLQYVKMGGFIIFTTKLNLNQEDQYQKSIDKLAQEQHWNYVTGHSFYRYDKLCGGQGKFSNKLVKIVAYQRTDHNEYLIREKDRLQMEAELEAARKADIEFKQRQKEEKLNKNQKEREAKKRALQMAAEEEKNAELREQMDAEEYEQKLREDSQKTQERREMMMKKLKTFMQNAMWIKLKALKKQEEERIEGLRVEAEKKRKQALLKRKQTIMQISKQPVDDDEEGLGKSPGFRAETNLLDQKHPA